MLVLASPPRAPCASSTSFSDWWVSGRVIARIWNALSRIMGWAGATPRPPDDSRIHHAAASDRDDVALTAHDCLTLLAVMVRCADAMRHSETEDDSVEFHRAADRMDRLMQPLISLRQTEMATPEPIDLSQLVAASEGMLKRAVAPGVALRLQLDVLRATRVRARRWDLERILLHLVINAARGLAAGEVVIETSTCDAFSALTVPRVGARPTVRLIVSGSASAQASSARIIARSGSGQYENDLGLAAVARLVQRLNGVLQFESDAERRTRIQVDLPPANGEVQDHPA